MIKISLDFVSSQRGILEIDEPVGFDKAGFTISSEKGKLGRSVSFAGGKKGFTFRINKDSLGKNHFEAFEWLNHTKNTIGYNATVLLNIHFDDNINEIGEIEFGTTYKTDGYSYVEFNVIQNSKVQLFENRKDTNVNLLSTTDLDNNPIDPIRQYKLLQKALPSIKNSKWINPIVGTVVVNDNPVPNPDVFNVIRGNEESEIPNSLSYYEIHDEGTAENFVYIDSKTTLTNLVIKFDLDVIFRYRPQENNSLTNDKFGEISLRLRYGKTYEDSTRVTIWQGNKVEGTSNQEYTLPKKLEYTLNELEVTDKVWIFFRSTQGNGAVTRTTFNECSITMSATSTGYSTVFNVVRLVDAMRFVAKYISGNDISAQRWDVGGQFYNQFITSASLIRNLKGKPFNISQKFLIDDYLPEVNGGCQTNADGTIYYGLYSDFYRRSEIGMFLSEPAEYSETTNDEYFCQNLEYKYKTFQSQKEEEKENTNDIVHGEAQLLYPNPKGQNTKTVTVGVIRDPQSIKAIQEKSYRVPDNAATSDDDKVYIIDSVVVDTRNTYIEETAFLQHTVDGNVLTLRNQTENDGGFDWSVLGIVPGFNFFIIKGVNSTPDAYKVISLNKNSITLQAPIGFTPVGDNGTSTRFRYSAVSDLVNRTNEGFQLITGLNNNNSFGNLLFTVGRNIRSYYSEFNATMCLNTVDSIKVTKYNNNPNLSTTLNATPTSKFLPLVEGASFRPSNPILSQTEINTTISCSLQEWIDLYNKIQTERGYIRIIKPDGMPCRMFVRDGVFTAKSAAIYDGAVYYGQADITGEELYMKSELDIVGSITDGISINDEIIPSDWYYSVDEYGKLSIFDYTGELLFIPTTYNKVSINGSVASTKSDLIKRISTINTKGKIW